MRNLNKLLLMSLSVLMLAACSDKENGKEEIKNSEVTTPVENDASSNSNLDAEQKERLTIYKDSEAVWSKMSEKDQNELISKIDMKSAAEVLVTSLMMYAGNPSELTKVEQYSYTNTGSYDFNENSVKKSDEMIDTLNPMTESLKKELETGNIKQAIPVVKSTDVALKDKKDGLNLVYDVKANVEFILGNKTVSYEVVIPDSEYSREMNTLQFKTFEYKKLN